MEFSQLLHTLLAFIFVLGLIFITLWLIKFCQQKGLSCHLGKCLKYNHRIKILEHHRLDTKNSAILLEYKDQEFLLILGPTSTLLLEQSPKGSSHHE